MNLIYLLNSLSYFLCLCQGTCLLSFLPLLVCCLPVIASSKVKNQINNELKPPHGDEDQTKKEVSEHHETQTTETIKLFCFCFIQGLRKQVCGFVIEHRPSFYKLEEVHVSNSE